MSAESKHVPAFGPNEKKKEAQIKIFRELNMRKVRSEIEWLIHEEPIRFKGDIARLLSILEAIRNKAGLVLGRNGGKDN